MAAYCSGFAKVKGTAPAIASYVNGHAVAGLVAKNDLTLVFRLVQPAPDFPNILAMGFSSARPVEYLKYVPDSAEFRQHTMEAPPVVQEFYRLNHTYQTRDFVQQKKREYMPLNKRRMGIWQAMEYLNTLVDDSDPDTDLSQLEHLLQTAEQIRKLRQQKEKRKQKNARPSRKKH